MPVTLSVRDVREALYRASDRSPVPQDRVTFTALLGTWFHECIVELTSGEVRNEALAALAGVEPRLDVWQRTLKQVAYDRCVKPRLLSAFAGLHDASSQVLSFWTAMRAACDWLAELCWTVSHDRSSRAVRLKTAWATLTDWLSTEEPLSVELREPHWTDSVRLVGIADALLQPVTTEHWCVIEFKLGESAPEADLGQAWLYHLMLSSVAEGEHSDRTSPIWAHNAGTLAVVRFSPERHEQLFDGAQLATARTPLMELIGRLAGVLPGQPHSRTLKVSGSPRPGTSLGGGATDEHREYGQRIVGALAEYGVTVSLERDPNVGPAFLRFPLTLGRGEKVKAVKSLSAELQVRLLLAVEPFVELERGQLVVDVLRPDRQKVWFSEIRSQLPQPQPRFGNSRVPIGIDLNGQLQFLDFSQTEHAHVLVAGTTGSGKSEWLRTALAGLLVTNTPETLQVLLIDPKRNAFHALRQSPFLWKPIVFPDEQSAADVLAELANEMDRRYRQLDGADSHVELVRNSNAAVPRIVCVVDEYFDLINRSKADRKAIEEQVCRLGSKARAAGIHLMIATQQPSRETIKGALDANIAARIGLKMEKPAESRMLFGSAGAERLLGHGDLLFKDLGSPKRLQAALLSPQDREQIFGGKSG